MPNRSAVLNSGVAARLQGDSALPPGDYKVLPALSEAPGERGSKAFHDATAPHLTAIRELFVDALTPEQVSAAGEVAGAPRAHLDGRA
ncbi:hypothetical protein [Nocardiopsis ganjiahuensis]|uniref:hypothetical protein n=1 Tax=Nocardiopsis ganjiahuensis TaxID=239984 RepID=UPI000344CD7B|nr:hypothetical protein [Nocardiopsis ganjiahuensis]